MHSLIFPPFPLTDIVDDVFAGSGVLDSDRGWQLGDRERRGQDQY